MPRQLRIDAAGALHHIIVRGIERKAIFRNNGDRNAFLERFGELLVGYSTLPLTGVYEIHEAHPTHARNALIMDCQSKEDQICGDFQEVDGHDSKEGSSHI